MVRFHLRRQERGAAVAIPAKIRFYTFRISDCIYTLAARHRLPLFLLTKNVMIMKEIMDFLTKEDEEYGLPMWFFMFALPGGLVILMALVGTL